VFLDRSGHGGPFFLVENVDSHLPGRFHLCVARHFTETQHGEIGSDEAVIWRSAARICGVVSTTGESRRPSGSQAEPRCHGSLLRNLW